MDTSYESIEVNETDKIVLNEKYETVQKALYEQHHIEEKNDMDILINTLLERVSFVIAEGLQLSENL